MNAGRCIRAVLLTGVLPFALLALRVSPSYASGEGCIPTWRLDLGTFSECEDVASLSPGNDTRVNLLLLLGDRHGRPSNASPPVTTPIFEWRDFRDRFSRDRFSVDKTSNTARFAVGEGSRCRSNDDGAAAFEAAVTTAKDLSDDERLALVTARKSLKADCAAASGPTAIVEDAVRNAKSEIGHAFATYLRGAEAFYEGRFDDAAKDFEALGGSAEPWLAETADYMAARTLVNRLQVGAFDTYGDFKGSADIDQQAATRAEARLEDYLKDHPKGRYAGSARGLLRRVDWLAGRNEKLAALYAALLAKPAAARDIDDVSLAEEIDSKLLPRLKPEMTKDPILLAVLDLKGMRKISGGKGGPPAVGLADVEAQREAFASASSLHEFLTAAAAFFVDGASAPVTKGLPDDTRRRDGDALWFSRQFLRGQALDAAADRNTRGFWEELYPGVTRPLEQSAVELALALHEESHGELEDVFATGSLVTNPALRTILLEHVAGPALLRARANDPTAPIRERKVALFTLLFKELTRGRYTEFRADVAGVPSDAPVKGSVAPAPEDDGEPALGLFMRGDSAGEIECPALPMTVSHLEQNGGSARDRLCLAEFVRVNGMDQTPLDTPTSKGDLGSTPSSFPGKPYARAATYRAIIASRQVNAADRAYALYRAIKCFEPTGNNECGGPDVPKGERKDWYDTLKHDYPTSRWARSLRYWW